MLYMLTGTEPSKLPQKAGRHDMSVVAASYEPSIVRVVSRLLAPSLTERYASANEAISDLYTAASLAPRTGFATLARPSDTEEWTYSLNVVAILRWTVVIAAVVSLLTYLFAGELVDRRINSLASDLQKRIDAPSYYTSSEYTPEQQWKAAHAVAYEHDLLLANVQVKSGYLRGETPIDIVDELKAIDAYDPEGMHKYVDGSERGNTYIRVKGTATGRVWFWSRERPVDITLVIAHRAFVIR